METVAKKKWSVVCVDDEEVILRSLRRQLREMIPDYRIEVSSRAEQVPELFARLEQRGRPAALLISDQVMPNMRGDELLRLITEQSPDTYQVMLTGQADGESVGRAVNNAKLFRFLAKPWSAEELALTVKKALESFHRDIELRRSAEALQRAHQRSLKFVPFDYLKALGREHLEEVERGDTSARRVSIMFADIRGFTRIVEPMSPQESFEFVNQFFSQTESTIYAHDGFVDNYAGDGVMAIFPEHPMNALNAAIDFSRAVDALNQEREKEGLEALEIGIGLHIGDVIMGVCGGGRSLQCTVIGDAVNLAARLEGMASSYQTRLVISDELYQGLQLPGENKQGEDKQALMEQNAYALRELDYVRAKGRSEPVRIYEVLDALPEKRRALRRQHQAQFQSGLEAMRAGETQSALESFQELSAHDPSDRASQIHLETCQRLLKGEALIDPQGVRTLREK